LTHSSRFVIQLVCLIWPRFEYGDLAAAWAYRKAIQR